MLLLQLWRLGTDADSNPTVQHMGSLIGGHTRTVNCIRFSPTGAQWHSQDILFVHPHLAHFTPASGLTNETLEEVSPDQLQRDKRMASHRA